MERRSSRRGFVLSGLVAIAGGALALALPVAGMLFAAVVLVAGQARLAYPRLLTSVSRPEAAPTTAAGEAVGVRLARGLLFAGILLSTFNGLRPGAHVTYGDVFFALSAIAVAGLVVTGVIRMRLPQWLLVSGGLVALAAVSGAVLARGEALHLLPAAFFIVSLVGVTALALVLLSQPRHVATALKVLAASAVVNAGVAVAAQLGVTDLSSRLMTWPIAGQQNGLTVHPNHLGLVCVLGIAVLYGLLRRSSGASSVLARAGGLAAGGILVAGVLVSGSRTTLVALAAVWLWAVVMDRSRRQRLVVLGAVAALVTLGGLLLWPPSVEGGQQQGFASLAERALMPEVAEGSNERRIDNLLLANREVQRAPLVGSGFGSARLAHNIYVQVLHAGGVLALLGFLTYVVNVVVRGSALLRARWCVDGSVLAATGATIAWLAAGLFQNALYDRYLYVAPALVVVLFEAAVRLGGDASSPGGDPSPAGTSHHRSV